MTNFKRRGSFDMTLNPEQSKLLGPLLLSGTKRHTPSSDHAATPTRNVPNSSSRRQAAPRFLEPFLHSLVSSRVSTGATPWGGGEFGTKKDCDGARCIPPLLFLSARVVDGGVTATGVLSPAHRRASGAASGGAPRPPLSPFPQHGKIARLPSSDFRLDLT